MNCEYCHRPFTDYGLLIGDKIQNELGQVMHEGCYNRWCGEHPIEYPPDVLMLAELAAGFLIRGRYGD